LECEPNSTIIPPFPCEPSPTFVPLSLPILVSSSNDDTEDENPPLPYKIPRDKPIEHEPAPTPQRPK